MTIWTPDKIAWLRENYPRLGKQASASFLGISEGSIRTKASKLKLFLDSASPFFIEWQRRAANSKIGKKRPAQADVMRQLHKRGKLRKTPNQLVAQGDRMKKHWETHTHSRGMLGKVHSVEARAKMSKAQTARQKLIPRALKREIAEKALRTKAIQRAAGEVREQDPKRSWKAGWRTIGDKPSYYRSRWEANYARYLQWMKERGEVSDWEHEPKTFWFTGIKRGCVSYLPDFRVTFPLSAVEWHEVKGWMDKKSITKIKRMQKYFPDEPLIVIESRVYKQIHRELGRLIEGWEYGRGD